MNIRTSLAIAAGKLAGAASRAAGRGGGTAVAGLAALRLDPQLVGRLVRQAGAGAVAVTGTNGKTTTALMLSRIAAEAGLAPLHNRSGSNMMRGIAAMLVEEATTGGRVPEAPRRMAILEVDEATLPELMRGVPLRAVIFTNLFRDQLDRYGEVDAVAAAWERALAAPGGGGPRPTLVLNADDPAVAHLGRRYEEHVLYYGVDDPAAAAESVEHASDFRVCLDCGHELAYARTHYGHVGHWRCPGCGAGRPTPGVRLTRVGQREDGLDLEIETAGGTLRSALPLAGLYQAYNALAAAAGALATGLPAEAVAGGLAGFSAAFGRQERFDVDGRDVRVLLGKNPTGLNQVLRTVAAETGERRVLFFLNDGIADGRDVSWIWDTDYELVRPGATWAMASGTRAEDLALRLKYAGFGPDVPVERDTAAALERALAATPAGARLYVLPTYTAMLDVRRLIAARAGARDYWEAP